MFFVQTVLSETDGLCTLDGVGTLDELDTLGTNVKFLSSSSSYFFGSKVVS